MVDRHVRRALFSTPNLTRRARTCDTSHEHHWCFLDYTREKRRVAADAVLFAATHFALLMILPFLFPWRSTNLFYPPHPPAHAYCVLFLVLVALPRYSCKVIIYHARPPYLNNLFVWAFSLSLFLLGFNIASRSDEKKIDLYGVPRPQRLGRESRGRRTGW